MSRSVNKIILVGTVGQDPDFQERMDGSSVAIFSLDTKREGEDADRTDWHLVNAWDRLAAFSCDYLTQGDRIYIEGRMEYDSYERDGITIPTATVKAREIVRLGPPKKN